MNKSMAACAACVTILAVSPRCRAGYLPAIFRTAVISTAGQSAGNQSGAVQSGAVQTGANQTAGNQSAGDRTKRPVRSTPLPPLPARLTTADITSGDVVLYNQTRPGQQVYLFTDSRAFDVVMRAYDMQAISGSRFDRSAGNVATNGMGGQQLHDFREDNQENALIDAQTKYAIVPAGTQAHILWKRGRKVFVKVLSGALAGKTGLVPDDWLHRS